MKEINITKEFLYRAYIVNKKSTPQIAEECNCGITTINRKLIKYNISRRTIAESIPEKYNINKNFLIKEYIKNKHTIQEISDQFGCSRSVIRRRLIKNNISRRTHSEAMKGKYIGQDCYAYVDGRKSKIYYCKEKGCDNIISYDSAVRGDGRCMPCANKITANKNKKFGKNNPNYIEGLIRIYPNKFNKILKQSIRARDNHVCQICGKTTKKNGRALDVHHIDYIKSNLDPENLISLCQNCHSETNGNRDIYQEYFKILLNILIS